MKSVSVHKGAEDVFEITAEIIDIDIPSPQRGQVLIEVICSGTNPKDWKVPVYMPEFGPHNTGDDIAGIVAAVGEDVTEFKVGDRVAALHELRTPFGSFAEYAIAWESTTFSLPDHISFETAATIPLAGLTAAMALHVRLGLPSRWQVRTKEQKDQLAGGIVVYGAAGAVGAFAIQLLQQANLHPVIAVAGNGIPFVESLIDKSKGDTIIDYRHGDEAVVRGIQGAVSSGQRLMYAFDAVSDHNSYQNVLKILDQSGHIACILPGKPYGGVPESVDFSIVQVGAVHGIPEDLWDFGYVYSRYLSLGLKQGWLTGHPFEVIPGGLAGVQDGLERLRDGKNSAKKYVYHVKATKGLESSHRVS